MKAIITTGVLAAAVAVTSVAAPASATINFGGASLAGNSAMNHTTSGHLGMHDGKITFDFDMYGCSTMNYATTGGFTVGNVAPVQNGGASIPAVNSADCGAATQVVNNPPANSTVTINGLCAGDAALVKANVTGNNVTVIVNSTGPCEEKGTPVPTTPVNVVVTPNAPQPTSPVVTASATTETPKGGAVADLPQTGANEVIASVIATILGGGAYAGTMAIRAFRARA